ncbi:MAG TPA: TIR domain-containing protein [Conexibacter sp.]|jgi:hypothetical protein
MSEPLLEEVFKTSGVPTHTFVAPSAFHRLRVALRTPGRGVVIEGPSGIGKTTAVTRALEDIAMAGSAQILSARVRESVEYIAELPNIAAFGVVVVDDFHVLPLEVKNSLADHLKVLADAEDAGSKLVIVGINRAGDALVRHAPDLAARIDVLRFEVEPAEKLEEVVRLGEGALNVKLSAAAQIVAAAQGSFYLAQMLSRELCLKAGITERQDHHVKVTAPYSSVKQSVMGQQESRFGPAVGKFARGPRFRPNGRANYLLLLKWLAESDRWDIVLREEIARHPEHRRSVGQVVDKGWLAGHARNDEIAQILHYDPDGKALSVEDPQLVFYLRNLDWRTFPRALGFENVELEHEYDFALSFAGEDRPLADGLNELLDADDYVVFYDLNEQARIVGEDIEALLGPIYASDSRFVIAILGRRYGEKRWPIFESDQFRARFDDGHVIPIWDKDALPSRFDETRRIGYLTFDSGADPHFEAARLAKIIKDKHAHVMRETTEPPQIQLDIDAAVTSHGRPSIG